jgi:hypothetical protein
MIEVLYLKLLKLLCSVRAREGGVCVCVCVCVCVGGGGGGGLLGVDDAPNRDDADDAGWPNGLLKDEADWAALPALKPPKSPPLDAGVAPKLNPPDACGKVYFTRHPCG